MLSRSRPCMFDCVSTLYTTQCTRTWPMEYGSIKLITVLAVLRGGSRGVGGWKCDEMSVEMYRNGENYWPFNNFYIWHLRDILIATSSELLLLTPDVLSHPFLVLFFFFVFASCNFIISVCLRFVALVLNKPRNTLHSMWHCWDIFSCR